MFKQPKDYDSAKSFGQGGFNPLPKGGYVCRIIQIEEMNDKNGKPMIHFAFDIIDGEYTGYFTDLYRSRKDRADNPSDVKFPFEGQMWIPIYDYKDASKTSPKFKGFCTALEDSGTEVWSPSKDFMTPSIKNAQIGIIFQRKEKEFEGNRSWQTVPWACRSVDTILGGDYFVPDDKPLSDAQPQPTAQPSTNVFGGFDELPDNFSAAEDDIPF